MSALLSYLVARAGRVATARVATARGGRIAATRFLSSSSGGSAPGRAAPTIGIARATLTALRANRNVYVDKTSAIADLLASDAGMHDRPYAFFARPRKFGKSLTLNVAAEMLAAGALPAGVTPWPGYAPVDVEAVFGGLAAHARLQRRDPSLRGLLERAHFVVKLSLGEAQTGAKRPPSLTG